MRMISSPKIISISNSFSSPNITQRLKLIVIYPKPIENYMSSLVSALAAGFAVEFDNSHSPLTAFIDIK